MALFLENLNLKIIRKYLILENLPNGLTLIRIILVIPLIIFLEFNNLHIVWFLIILGGITDYLDGYLAKKLNIRTKFGAIIDPLADKIFFIIPFLWLCKNLIIPYWSLSILIIREFIILSLRSSTKTGLPAVNVAKYKTLFQFTSLFVLFTPTANNYFLIYGLTLYWISFFFSIYSMYKYLRVK